MLIEDYLNACFGDSSFWTLEVLYNTSVTQALDKSLSDRGVGRTHIWYIMTIDCNAPTFLTPDENIRLV